MPMLISPLAAAPFIYVAYAIDDFIAMPPFSMLIMLSFRYFRCLSSRCYAFIIAGFSPLMPLVVVAMLRFRDDDVFFPLFHC